MWLYHLELSSTAFKDNLKVIKLENQFSLKEEKSEDNSELAWQLIRVTNLFLSFHSTFFKIWFLRFPDSLRWRLEVHLHISLLTSRKNKGGKNGHKLGVSVF